ncbi:MAG: hypothetical protein IJG94_04185 [Clostridia bacterium]|nr:hypothetical protein [Clostridia bacterium]
MTALSSRLLHASSFRKYAVYVLIAAFGYLGQVCVMPYIKIFDVTPNLLFALIGIVTVAYGKLRTFWLGLLYGLLMEIMVPSVPILNLATYSLSALFCSFAFSDKPLKTLEYERATRNERKELQPWLRTLLCTLLNVLIYEVIHITYIYLDGFSITFTHILRGLADIVLTGVLCLGLMFPIRRAIFGPKSRARRLQSAPVVFTRN